MIPRLYSDFSDTIATPINGLKFPPFEIELGKIVASLISSPAEKELFTKTYEQGYEKFSQIRRDDSIPFEERMVTWLAPFTGKLNKSNLIELTKTFKININFLSATDQAKQVFGLKKLEITIVSGTVTQLIQTFLDQELVSNELHIRGLTTKTEATELVFDKNGYFTGQIKPVKKIVYLGAPTYPNNYLIFGDDAMETYGGFGESLLNVQTYNPKIVLERINKHKYSVFN